MDERARRRLRPFATAAKIALTAIVCVVLLVKIELRHAISLWARIDPGWTLAALALLVPNFASQYGRWRVGLRRAHPETTGRTALRSLLFGIAMAAVTPASVGEFGQVVLLPPGRRRQALGALLVIRLWGFLWTIALAWAAWIAMPSLLGTSERTAWMLGGTAFLGAAVWVAANEYLLRSPDRPIVRQIVRRLPDMEPGFAGVRMVTIGDRARIVGWSALLSFTYLTQFTLLARAFGARVDLLPGIAAGAATIGIATLLPFTVGSIGVRESAAVVVWRAIGVAAPAAFNAAFALFLMNVVLPGLVGLGWNVAVRRKGERRPAVNGRAG